MSGRLSFLGFVDLVWGKVAGHGTVGSGGGVCGR